MKKIIKRFLILILVYHSFFAANTKTKPKKAVVIVPVANLIDKQAYEQLSIFENRAPLVTYPRIHQLLFNEVVDILEENEKKVIIRIPHLFYLTPTNNKPQTTYCIAKKNIIPFDKIQKNTGDLTKIPLPLSFKNNTEQLDRNNIVTLTKPWFDEKTKQTFSAGTRFIYVEKKKRKINVHLFNPQTMQYYVAQIPNNKCMTYNKVHTPQQLRNNFITILQQWAKNNKHFIPYVLGGCSFTGTTKGLFGNKMESPKTGFDCSGMIARAAQMCGIPYFYKNTTTIKQFLTPLAKDNKLIPGDIIWIPGHVMVIASLTNNTLIEARGYEHGYGRVHEIPLNEEFKGINTYHDLINVYHNNKTIIRLDRNGNERETITNLKLLQLINKKNKQVSL